MNLQLSEEDLLFEQKFKAFEINPSDFNHRAHLRLTWIHIIKYGVGQAIINITGQIKEFVESVDAADKYHETLTVASIYIVNSFVLKSQTIGFDDFILEFPLLDENFIHLINQHYSKESYNLDIAKNKFIEPDLLPFN